MWRRPQKHVPIFLIRKIHADWDMLRWARSYSNTIINYKLFFNRLTSENRKIPTHSQNRTQTDSKEKVIKYLKHFWENGIIPQFLTVIFCYFRCTQSILHVFRTSTFPNKKLIVALILTAPCKIVFLQN